MSVQNRKSQQDSEQPAKVYQLDFLSEKFDSLSSLVNQNFDRLNANVNTLLTNPQVSPQTLADTVSALEKRQDEKIQELIATQDLKIQPVINNNKWFLRTIVAQAVIIFSQVVYLIIASRT